MHRIAAAIALTALLAYIVVVSLVGHNDGLSDSAWVAIFPAGIAFLGVVGPWSEP